MADVREVLLPLPVHLHDAPQAQRVAHRDGGLRGQGGGEAQVVDLEVVRARRALQQQDAELLLRQRDGDAERAARIDAAGRLAEGGMPRGPAALAGPRADQAAVPAHEHAPGQPFVEGQADLAQRRRLQVAEARAHAERLAVVEEHRPHLRRPHRLHAAPGDALQQHVELEVAVEDVRDLLEDLEVPERAHLLVEQARVLDGGRDLGGDAVQGDHVAFVEGVQRGRSPR